MSILPPEVRAGYVYDRVLRAIGDRPYDDDRLPDGIPAQGKVIFRPKTSVKQLVSGGRGVTITREPVTCTIHQGEKQIDDPDASKGGLLIDEAGAVGGVWLVVGEWTVEYHMEDRYSNIPNEEIIVTEEHTEDNPLDVALASEITPTPTQKFVVNEQVYVDTLTARDEVQDNLHNMVISGEVVGDDLQLTQHGGDTIVAGNVRGPRGPQGIQGPPGTLELIGGDNPAITVDTSVGTRVFVGDTMIYGDTGWRELSLPERFISGRVLIKRENINVTLRFDEVEITGLEDISVSDYLTPSGYIPIGFRPLKYGDRPAAFFVGAYAQYRGYITIAQHSRILYLASTADENLGTGTARVSGELSWTTNPVWPDTLQEPQGKEQA